MVDPRREDALAPTVHELNENSTMGRWPAVVVDRGRDGRLAPTGHELDESSDMGRWLALVVVHRHRYGALA